MLQKYAAEQRATLELLLSNSHQIAGTPRSNTGVYVRKDLLTDDPANCLGLPGDTISPGHSRTFDVTVGSNYTVLLGVGIWDLNSFTCPASAPFFKETWFTDPDYGQHWVWVTVTVTNHVSGNWQWTVTGSYLDGSLTVTPAGNQPIPFTVTTYDPIP